MGNHKSSSNPQARGEQVASEAQPKVGVCPLRGADLTVGSATLARKTGLPQAPVTQVALKPRELRQVLECGGCRGTGLMPL